MFIADSALTTSVVVKTVVTVNLVTENFPLDTTITSGPEQSLWPVSNTFFLSRILTKPELGRWVTFPMPKCYLQALLLPRQQGRFLEL